MNVFSRWCSFVCGAFVAGIYFGITPNLFAQQTAAVPSSLETAPHDSVKEAKLTAEAVAAAAEADTGRMMPGYQNFSRYNTPGYCLGAMRGIQESIWRNLSDEKRVRGTGNDTLPTAAIKAGRACLDALDVQKVRPIELYNLVRLSVQLGDTARVWAAIEQLMAQAKSVEEQGYVLFDAMEALLNASPIQHGLAMSVLTRLDGLGKDARVPRFLAHQRVRYDALTLYFDTTAINHEGQQIDKIERMLTSQERMERKAELGSIFNDSVELAWYRLEPNLPMVARAYYEKWIDGVPEFNATDELKTMLLGRIESIASVVGTPAEPIDGGVWFPNDVARPQPERGKVTIMRTVRLGGAVETDVISMLRRLYNKYHDQGLEIVLVAATEGYSWSSPPQKPEDEMKTIAWYFLDYLKLPFKLMVEETPFTKRADGRRVSQLTSYLERHPTATGITGRDGRVFTFFKGTNYEAEIDAYVKKALAQPVPSERSSQ